MSLYSWQLQLGDLPGGLDGLGDIGLAVNVSRDACRGLNMLFEVFDVFQGWQHVMGP